MLAMAQIRRFRRGTWDWNDEKNELEFTRSSIPPISKIERKERSSIFMGSKEIMQLQHRPQDRPSDHLLSWAQANKSPEKPFFILKPWKNQRNEFVSLEDIKRVALSLIHEQERMCLQVEFSSFLRSKELDEFLLAVINYTYCYLIRRSRGKKPEPLLISRRPSEKESEMSNLDKRLDAALRHLAIKYTAIILGEGLEEKHHLACGKSKTSATWRDRRFFECLYSFSIKVAWITFKRKKLEPIERELCRVFHTKKFQTKLETKRNLPGDETSEDKRKVKLPPIYRTLNQRSPLVTSLLPTAKDLYPHLLQRRGASKKNMRTAVNSFMDEFPTRLGIIGEPMKNFHFKDLTPLEPGEEEEEDPQECKQI
ncbi:protein phosphatase 1 regulatory subunit 36-like [Dendropsophus ebraccatus]|uniref:protein phosphatase 1 regulatory subunit 36-like n=1 Tax=Dendropsophus ebraccatus TaxID=150705 RepID=UPI003831C99B